MGPWILSLDASTPATVVAVGRVGELSPRADVVSIARANQTSERLTDHVHGCLTRAGISRNVLITWSIASERIGLSSARGRRSVPGRLTRVGEGVTEGSSRLPRSVAPEKADPQSSEGRLAKRAGRS